MIIIYLFFFLIRYDVRNLIEDKITLEKLENITNSPNIEESLYDEERYQDLDSEEEKLNEMSEDEREIYLGTYLKYIIFKKY